MISIEIGINYECDETVMKQCGLRQDSVKNHGLVTIVSPITPKQRSLLMVVDSKLLTRACLCYQCILFLPSTSKRILNAITLTVADRGQGSRSRDLTSLW